MLYTNVIKMPNALLLPINSSMLWNVPDLLPQPVPATPYSIPWHESGPCQQRAFPATIWQLQVQSANRPTSADTGYYHMPVGLAVLDRSQACLIHQVNTDLKLHMNYM